MEIKKNLTLEDFRIMEKLEQQYYASEYITPALETYEWYLYDIDTIRVAVEKEKIIGFCNFFPIAQEKYTLLETGILNDSELTYESIVRFEDKIKEVNLFLSCIVVDQGWQGKGVSLFLLESYLRYFEKWIDKGVKIKGIITDNVTLEGEKFSQRIGLTFKQDSNHQSKIYHGTFETVKQVIQIAIKKDPKVF